MGNGGAAKTAAKGDKVIALFRSVSKAELDDIKKIKGFRPKPGGRSYETKLFTKNVDDAIAEGKVNYGKSGSFEVVKVEIPTEMFEKLWKCGKSATDNGILIDEVIGVNPSQMGDFNKALEQIQSLVK